MSKLLETKKLNFAYDDKLILSDINLTVNESEIVLINGESGSGKTTLLKLIGKQLDASNTFPLILLKEKAYSLLSEVEIRKEIGVVNQEADLQLCRITVEDEIRFGLENLQYSESKIEVLTQKFLRLAGLDEKRKLLCKFLSGGEKQKLIIASILAMGRSLILMDEPLSHLDHTSRLDMIDFIRGLKSEGLSFIIIEHRVSDLIRISDKKYTLSDGRLTKFDSKFYSFKKTGIEKKNDVIMNIDNLSYFVKGKQILKDLNFSVRPGDFIGVFGDNGTGKSTLLQCLKSLLPFNGTVKSEYNSAILLQNPDLSLIERTVFKTVPVPNLLYAADLYEEKDKHPLCLSKGQRLRLAFLNIIQKKPAILLLDEITSGQDPEHIQKIFDLLNYDELKALLLVSHDKEILEAFCNRFFIIKDKALKEIEPKEFFSNN